MTGTDDADPDTLLFSSSFFGYYLEIVRELEGRGRKVAWFEDRPGIDVLSKTLIRLNPDFLESRSRRHFSRAANTLAPDAVRDVIIVKGEALSVETIKKLRQRFSSARFTIYFWDSYRNMPVGSRSKVDLFDSALTFDPDDAVGDERLLYRPLFFSTVFSKIEDVTPDIDLSFVGTAHGDRYGVVKSVAAALPSSKRVYIRLYLPSRGVFEVRRLLDHRLLFADRSWFVFEPLSRLEVSEIVARSRVCLDIERPIQSGLSPRVLEVMGAGRKIATTNAKIQRADFYNPQNVWIMDRNNPTIPQEFFDSPAVVVPSTIREKYTLKAWVDDVVPATRSKLT